MRRRLWRALNAPKATSGSSAERCGSIVLALFLGVLVGQDASAQAAGETTRSSRSLSAELSAWTVALPELAGAGDDLVRLSQLRGRSTRGFLLRSPSSLMVALGDSLGWRVPALGRWALLIPSVGYTRNSALPFSMNDGALWAGKGANTSVVAGMRWELDRLQLVIAPQFIREANRSLPFYDNLHSGLPLLLPPYRSEFSTLWNITPTSIDAPFRFGDRPRSAIDAGASSLGLLVGAVRLGASTEPEWWGPGIQNALLLSNNASGIPRLFIRSARPLRTPVGAVEFSTFLGRLDESPFFRTPDANTLPGAFSRVGTESRLVSAAALVWQPRWKPDLAVGLARAVYAPRIYRGPIAWRWLDVFANTGQPNDRPVTDTTALLGRDQLVSLFARWVFPDDGFEIYFDWLRASMPVSLRDFLTDPNHSRGYTLGLQWLGPAILANAAVRLQGEITNLERDGSFRWRPLGSIYTSRVVPQGYTQRGQPLGAAIGPGSSSQWLAVDFVGRRWALGLFGERVRWNEDGRDLIQYPDFKGWCENDVSLIGGVRGRWVNRISAVSASLATSRRYNAFFQNFAACPLMPTDPGRVEDVRNVTLRVTFEPLSMVRP